MDNGLREETEAGIVVRTLDCCPAGKNMFVEADAATFVDNRTSDVSLMAGLGPRGQETTGGGCKGAGEAGKPAGNLERDSEEICGEAACSSDIGLEIVVSGKLSAGAATVYEQRSIVILAGNSLRQKRTSHAGGDGHVRSGAGRLPEPVAND